MKLTYKVADLKRVSWTAGDGLPFFVVEKYLLSDIAEGLTEVAPGALICTRTQRCNYSSHPVPRSKV